MPCPGPKMMKFRGPPLWNIVGRPVAAMDGFKYSPVMQGRGGKWNFEDLNIFISDPCRTLPGTDMGSNGLQDEADRADLIVYLSMNSDEPMLAEWCKPCRPQLPAADFEQPVVGMGSALA